MMEKIPAIILYGFLIFCVAMLPLYLILSVLKRKGVALPKILDLRVMYIPQEKEKYDFPSGKPIIFKFR